MALLNATAPTLIDWAKKLDPDGKPARIVELLAATNEALPDIPFKEANGITHHRTTMRSGLSTPTWRLFNQGVQPTKTSVVQVDDAIGMLEDYAEVDKALADLNGNTSDFRLSEAVAHLEGMNQAAMTSLIYGNNGTNPEQFNGLAVRYNTVNPVTAAIAQNVIEGGGTGTDNTSVWLVCWGDNTVHGVFPKGSTAGLQHRDLGEVTIENANGVSGARMQAYRDHFKWNLGVCVRDWRYAVRIANIDTSNLVSESSAADLVKLLIKAKHRIPNMGMGKCVIYCNRTVRQMLDIQALNKSQQVLAIREAAGQFQTDFLGIPIKTVDAILNTEARVV